MPLYCLKCTACGNRFEQVARMHEREPGNGSSLFLSSSRPKSKRIPHIQLSKLQMNAVFNQFVSAELDFFHSGAREKWLLSL